MKAYTIELAKKVIAEFTMHYDEFSIKFKCTSDLIAWIVSHHPELKECPADYKITAEDIVVKFFSLGDAVIVEK